MSQNFWESIILFGVTAIIAILGFALKGSLKGTQELRLGFRKKRTQKKIDEEASRIFRKVLTNQTLTPEEKTILNNSDKHLQMMPKLGNDEERWNFVEGKRIRRERKDQRGIGGLIPLEFDYKIENGELVLDLSTVIIDEELAKVSKHYNNKKREAED